MKNHLHNETWLYRIVVALSRQSTPEVCVAVAFGSAVIGGLAGLLAPSLIYR
jgi:hypothetical protein